MIKFVNLSLHVILLVNSAFCGKLHFEIAQHGHLKFLYLSLFKMENLVKNYVAVQKSNIIIDIIILCLT